MNSKEKSILNRIAHLEDAILKGREYLESGKHADWHGFRPLFVDEGAPPHKGWVRNVFIPRREKSLSKAHNALERVRAVEKHRRTSRARQPALAVSIADVH